MKWIFFVSLLSLVGVSGCNSPSSQGTTLAPVYYPNATILPRPVKIEFSQRVEPVGVAGEILASEVSLTILDQFNKPYLDRLDATLELYSDPECKNALTHTPNGKPALEGEVETFSSAGRVIFRDVKINTAAALLYVKADVSETLFICSPSIRIDPAGVSLSESRFYLSDTTAAVGDSVSVGFEGLDAFGNSHPKDILDVIFSYSGVGSGHLDDATGSDGLYTSAFLAESSGLVTMALQVNGEDFHSTLPLTISAQVPAPETSSIASTSGILANNSSAASIIVKLFDHRNYPIAGFQPTLNVSGSSNTVNCSVSGHGGVANCSLTTSKAEVKTITLTSSELNLVTHSTFLPGTPEASATTFTATTQIVANGVEASLVSVTLKDAFQNPVVGTVPVFSATGTANTVGACSATLASGVSTCELKSTTAQTKTLTLSSPAGLNKTALVVFKAGVPDNSRSSISANGPTLATGRNSSTVTVNLKDAFGNPVASFLPVLHVTGSGNTVGMCGRTDTAGNSVCLVKSTVAETKTISLTAPVAISKTASAVFITP